MSNTDIVLLFLRRPSRPQFDAARQAARGVSEKIQHDLGNFFGRHFPVRALRGIAAPEFGRDGSRRDHAHADVVVTNFLHERVGKCVDARFRRAVRGGFDERIGAREAADVDDRAAAAPPKMRNRRVTGVVDPGRFVSRISDHCAGVMSATSAKMPTPALLIRMSSPPKRPTVALIARSMSS